MLTRKLAADVAVTIARRSYGTFRYPLLHGASASRLRHNPVGNLAAARRLTRSRTGMVAVVTVVLGLLVGDVAVARGFGSALPGVTSVQWPDAPPRRDVVPADRLERLRASARRSAAPVEVDELRTSRSRTFVAGDGTVSRRFSGGPGVGGAVEASWGGPDPGGVGRLAWPDSTGDAVIDLGGGDAFDGSLLTGLRTLGWSGLVARFEAAGGARLESQADGAGVRQRIVIARRPSAPMRFVLALSLRGLDARASARGGVEFVDAAGRVFAATLPGVVAGARTDQLTRLPLRTAAVRTGVVAAAGGGQALELVPDASFLSDPDLRFPVTLDTGLRATGGPSSLSAPPDGEGFSTSGFDPMCGGVGDCPPGAPVALAATAFNEKLDLTWGAPADGSEVDGYTVSVHRASDGVVVASRYAPATFAPQAAFTFRDGLVNGQSYYARVYAYNYAGSGPYVTSATVTPAAAPWSQFDLFGQSNPSQPSVTCRTSWGVNCATGNFAWSRTYLSIPGRGIGLGFTLTYNSQDPFRWTHNYRMRLESVPGGARRIHQENGSTAYFFDDGAGGWHAAGGTQATLTRDGAGNYVFTRIRGLTTHVFDASGRMLWQADRNGYRTTLTYGASNPDQPIRATDSAGRYLAFSYDSSGRLVQVTDSSGRRVSLGYAASLPEVPDRLTDPAGGVTTFEYDTNREYHVTAFRSPNANRPGGSGSVTRVAYREGQSVDGGDPATARTMGYAYTSEASPPGTAGTNTATITDPSGKVAVAQHRNHLLTSITQGSGTAQAATTSLTRDAVSMRPTVTTDPRGKVWRSTYDARANLLTSTDPLNRTATSTYNAQSLPLTRTDALGVADSYALTPTATVRASRARWPARAACGARRTPMTRPDRVT